MTIMMTVEDGTEAERELLAGDQFGNQCFHRIALLV